MAQGFGQAALFIVVLVALTPLLGKYMARVFSGRRTFLTPVFGPVERLTYRVLRVDPDEEQDWKAYAKSLVLFSVFSWIALYLILRTQGIQPFNPEGFHSGPWDVSFNTASTGSSFVSLIGMAPISSARCRRSGWRSTIITWLAPLMTAE